MSAGTRNTIGQILTVVGGIVGEATSWTGVGAVIGWGLFAIGLALQVQSSLQIQRDAKARANAPRRSQGIQANIRGSLEHHNLVFGKVRVGGVIVALGSNTPAGSTIHNSILYLGIAHSLCHAGGCEGIVDIWIDDTHITAANINGSGDVTVAPFNLTGTGYSSLVNVTHYRGTGTQAADATLTSLSLDDSTAYRRGIAWTLFKLARPPSDSDWQKAFKQGVPQCDVELKGIRVYDPRLDSSNGGSGAQRFTDVTTWTWSNNPALCASTYMMMAISDGGMGLPTSRIDWPSVAAAANNCDEVISTPGGNRSRFSCNGVLSTSDTREVNLQKILDSMQGKRVTVGNLYKLFADVYRTPTVAIDASWLTGPATITTLDPLESLYNAVRINFDDSANDYKTIEAPPNTNVTYETQDGGIRIWRDVNLPMVSDTYQAQYIAQLLSNHSRRQMTVELLCNLKALDVEAWETCTLTLNSEIDLSTRTFRVAAWEIEQNGIKLTLREDASSVYTVGTFQTPQVVGSPTVGTTDPGNISTPIIIDGIDIQTKSGFEIWCGAYGASPNWGGCEVWLSTDQVNYSILGQIDGASTYGVVQTSTFPSDGDPDTTDTLHLDLTSSAGVLSTFTSAQADAYASLAYLDGELIAFSTVTQTATNKYDLSAYMRRAIYGTVNGAHVVGGTFLLLDSHVAKIAYPSTLVGKTVYLKFPSYDKTRTNRQNIASVTAYPYTIGGGLGAPADVTNFAAQPQSNGVCLFTWDQVTAANIAGYEIRFNPQGDTTWNDGTELTKVTRGTQITTVRLPPGSWTCLIKAVDSSQRYSINAATANVTQGAGNNQIIQQLFQSPDWLGTKVNCGAHYQGQLFPLSNSLASAGSTGWEIFDQYVFDPVSSMTYTAPEMDLTFDSVVRLYAPLVSNLGPGVAMGVANPTEQMEFKTSAGSYAGFQNWNIGSPNCRYATFRFTADITKGLIVVQSYTPTADAPTNTQGANGVPIAIGGTAITFPTRYHNTPTITVTAQVTGGAVRHANVMTSPAASPTGFSAQEFDQTGADVGGNVNWSASGV